jgi:hypothetical protein
MKTTWLLVPLLVVTGGSARADKQRNGVNMNGVNMNGVNMNGVNMNGVNMNGVMLDGVALDDVTVDGLWLDGSLLEASLVDVQSSCAHSQRLQGTALPASCSKCAAIVDAQAPACGYNYWDATCVQRAQQLCVMNATQMVGATFTANTSGGGTRQLRLDGVRQAPGQPDLWLYAFSYWKPTPIVVVRPTRPTLRAQTISLPPVVLQNHWTPICGSAPDNDGLVNMAVAVGGQWMDCGAHGRGPGCGGKISNEGFTLACTDEGAIAKCVERQGYKPWKVHYTCNKSGACNGQSLEPYLEACVRMVRDDYCGDGFSYTVDHTQIDVYDNLGLQLDTETDGEWPVEAAWTPDGAACFTNIERIRDLGERTDPVTGRLLKDEFTDCWGQKHPRPPGDIDGTVMFPGCGRPGSFKYMTNKVQSPP